MNQLKVVSQNGKLVTDSREVAEMINKEHKTLLRDIRKYIEYMGTEMNPSSFFIESYYQDAYGRNKSHFLLTKKGCDMVANKMTGQKGVLFTATYVTKFEEMEKELKEVNKPSYMIDDPIKRAEKWIVEQKETQELKQENELMKPKAAYHDLVLQTKSLLSVTKIAKDYGMGAPTLNKILHELGIQYKQGGTWTLYYKYQDEGYAQTKTHTIDAEKSNVHLYWTQKGRMFIYEILKEKKGIIPLIEKENEQLRLVD